MAVTLSNLTSGANGAPAGGSTAFTTGSVSISAGSLVLASCMFAPTTAGAPTITVTGAGLTWNLVASAAQGSWYCYTFAATASSATSGAITFSFSKAFQYYSYIIDQAANAAVILNSVTGNSTGTNTGISVTLPALSPGSVSYGVAAFSGNGSSSNWLAGSGYTQLAKPGASVSAGAAYESGLSEWNSAGSTTVNWTRVSSVGASAVIGLEISGSSPSGTGAADGAGTAAAAGLAIAGSPGSSGGTGAAAAVALSTAAALGAGAGLGIASGVGRTTVSAVGTASGIGGASAVGAGGGVGLAIGTGLAAGVGRSLAEAVGTASGAGATSGVGRAFMVGVGTASGFGAAYGFLSAYSIGVGQAAANGNAFGGGFILTPTPVERIVYAWEWPRIVAPYEDPRIVVLPFDDDQRSAA